MIFKLLNLLLMGCGIVLLFSSFRSSEKEVHQALSRWAMDSFLIGPIIGWIGKKLNVKSPYRKAMIVLGIFMITVAILNYIHLSKL